MDEASERPAKPWDLFDKELGRVEQDVAAARLELCKGCDQYNTFLHQCKECGCFMNAKVTLPNAFCPLRKWSAAPASSREKG